MISFIFQSKFNIKNKERRKRNNRYHWTNDSIAIVALQQQQNLIIDQTSAHRQISTNEPQSKSVSSFCLSDQFKTQQFVNAKWDIQLNRIVVNFAFSSKKKRSNDISEMSEMHTTQKRNLRCGN